MNTQTIETIGIAVALITFITIRQALWQTVNLGKLLRMPVVFALIGVVSLGSSVQQLGPQWHLSAIDVLIIGSELALGLLAGWLMGRSTQIRSLADGVQSRLAPVGIAVWLGFIAIRIGLAVAAHTVNAGLAEQTGTILIVVAVIKAVQAVVVRGRIERHRIAERRRSYDAVGV